MKLNGEVTGIREVSIRLVGMPDRIRSEVRLEMDRQVERVQLHVQRDYLSGQALNARTGRLRNSIATRVETLADKTISGQIFSRGVPYARIQHDGGKTAPHMIYPKNGKALHFFGARDGLELFLSKVNHPGSKIKGTFYLARGLYDLRHQIIADLFAAAIRGAKK